MANNLTILLEEDYSSNNFSAYIPELRLSVVGDTEAETLAFVEDLIRIELEKGAPLKRFSSKVVTMQVEDNPAFKVEPFSIPV